MSGVETVTNEEIKALIIDLIHAQPVLWNLHCEQYKLMKTKAKDVVWKKIAEELHVDSM